MSTPSDSERTLVRADLPDDPLALFARWFQDAIDSGMPEPNAMALATVGDANRPSCRMVLLKHFDARGFLFFTNYTSTKGRQLADRPHAALTFWWPPLERQVRIEGRSERTSAAESDEYFASRPRDSQLASAASPQSRPISNRAELDQRIADLAERHRDTPIPRPGEWGGFRVVPDAIEFWQGRTHRAHDRFRYERRQGGWSIVRLAP